MHLTRQIGFIEFAQRCHLSQAELSELLDYGLLPVLQENSSAPALPITCLRSAQKAAQIKRDYALDLFSMGILMVYLQKIEALELANTQLRSSLVNLSEVGSTIIWRDL
jgi:chaperone modulatory protein CbpM